MEHRWGTRKAVTLHVRLRTVGGVAAVGTLRDISVSGAFIMTAASIKLHQPIQLTVYGGAHHKTPLGSFDAHVVRKAAHEGIGIEWSELAPQSLSLLERQGRTNRRAEREDHEEVHPEPGRAGRSHAHYPSRTETVPQDETAPPPSRQVGLRRRGSRLR